MNTSHPTRFAVSRQLAVSAFTLLELLVVISIIAVLAGILLPVTGSVMETARKTSAKNTVSQIVTAMKSFQTDYGVYPTLTTTTAGKDTTVGGNVNTNSELFSILRAADSNSPTAPSPNSRRIVYFEGKDVKSPTKPKDGFLPTGGSTSGNAGATLTVGDLIDPWGNRYFVCYDSGYDDAVAHPYVTTPGAANDSTGLAATSLLRFGVIAWCYGKDGAQGKTGTAIGAPPNLNYGDDVVSWQ